MARLAIWSLGEHARRNLVPATTLAEGVSLVGVFSRNRTITATVAAKHGCRTWESPQDMLADADIDTVFIAGPNGVHFEQCHSALLAGKHVWCEKTLAPSLAETEALLSLAGSHGLVLAEAFMFAYHPQFAALKALVDGGELGQIASIRCSFGFPHLAAGNIRYSRGLAGGALLDTGAYCVAAPLMLLDRSPDLITGHTFSASGYEVDTGGVSILHFPGHSIAIGDWGFGRAYRNEIEVWGEDGHAVVRRAFSKPPALDTSIEILRDNVSRRIEIKGGTNHFAAMMCEFSKAASDIEARKQLAAQTLRQAKVLAAIRRGAYTTLSP